jgi:hypothetical protein
LPAELTSKTHECEKLRMDATLLMESSAIVASAELEDAKSNAVHDALLKSLEEAKIALAEKSALLGDAEAKLGDAEAKLGDAEAKLGDAISELATKTARLADLEVVNAASCRTAVQELNRSFS